MVKKLLSRLFNSPDQTTVKKAWVYREPRVKASALNNLWFKPEGSGEQLSVANVSFSGIALIQCPFTKNLSAGAILKGRLNLNGDLIDLSIVIARHSQEIVAGKLASRNLQLEKVLKKYFNIEISAMKMVKMKDEHIKPSDEGKPYCYNGENHSQLYFIVNGTDLIYFEFSFFGHHIEASKGENVKFGNMLVDEMSDGIKYKGSTLVDRNLDHHEEIKDIAVSFLKNIENLDPAHLAKISSALQSGKL